MELVGSSSLVSSIFILGGGGGGGGLILPTAEGEEVEDDTILNSTGSVLKTIVDVCIIISKTKESVHQK